MKSVCNNKMFPEHKNFASKTPRIHGRREIDGKLLTIHPVELSHRRREIGGKFPEHPFLIRIKSLDFEAFKIKC